MEMLINGNWVAAIEKEVISIYNPATHQLIDNVPLGKTADINLAVEYAKEGYKINRAIPAIKRSHYLNILGNLVLDNLDELTKIMVLENGKSWSWAAFEVRKSAEIFKTLADRSKDPQGQTFPMDAMDGCATQMSMVYRQPRGIVGGIIPFNFPLEMLAYKVGGALAAGNSIVVKLSEDCPLTCLKVGELMLEAGVPKEAVHLISGYAEAGDALSIHPKVPMISFTGSSEVGKIIMERSAKYLKHLSLELGGNDPVIVFKDADLDLIASNIVRGRMTVGNGQACVADKRFIVQEDVYDVLIEKCKQIVTQLKIGDPMDKTTDVGPVINEAAAIKIENQIKASVQLGAKIIIGGNRINKTFIEPTIVANVTKAMTLFTEECFGPVAPFIKFKTEEEAIDLANDSDYGLQGAVYSQDISRAMRVADAIEVGGVVINGSSCFRPGNVPYMPRKQSGIGTDNMYNAYQENTTGKAIVINNAINRFN
ncbi:aldehyde dehydrogenase family protein [Flavobacteriaceae bacterium]|nr:aldehyde dehydrogenase family protein [Flavobacteriaceae bacterium]